MLLLIILLHTKIGHSSSALKKRYVSGILPRVSCNHCQLFLNSEILLQIKICLNSTTNGIQDRKKHSKSISPLLSTLMQINSLN